MRYEDFCKTHDDTKSDPLVDWIDDPSTSSEDIFAHMGPLPTMEDLIRIKSEMGILEKPSPDNKN